VKVSVLAFDLADNATGRADLLARLLRPRYEVEVVGPQFGPALWGPARDGPVVYRAVRAGRYPRFAARVADLLDLVDGDVIFASKPRPTSYGLGLLARARRRRPLVLDVDDWGMGFFHRGGRWGTLGRALNLGDPNGLAATWLMERLIGRADALTVASRFLERRFGGTLLTHVRDTEAWDPARWQGSLTRADLGVGEQRVVMFLGTPREHKGVDDLAEAVRSLGAGVVLVVVGVNPTSSGARSRRRRPRRSVRSCVKPSGRARRRTPPFPGARSRARPARPRSRPRTGAGTNRVGIPPRSSGWCRPTTRKWSA